MNRRVEYLFALMFSLALGCDDDDSPGGQADLGASSDTDGGEGDAVGDSAGDVGPDTPDAESDQDPSAVPMIQDVLTAETCPEGARPPTTQTSLGTALRRLTLDAPNAVCNDGSPGVLFVRAAGSEEMANTWVLHLQAGGGCGAGFGPCAIRWCGNQLPYDAGKMSSRFTAESMGDNGIFHRVEGNRWGNANQVFFYYCSSDAWAGQASDVVLSNEEFPDDEYRLHFRGHTIVEAAVDLLAAGVASDDGQEVLPPMSDAELIVFTGASAGAAGTTHNVDWFTGRFADADTRVVAIMDSNFPPGLETLPEEEAALLAQAKEAHYQNVFVDAYGPAFVDQSCLAYHAGDGDQWLCDDLAHVLRNHITTPFFAYMDLLDPVIADFYLAHGATMPQFSQAVAATLAVVPDVAVDAEEAEEIDVTPGVYGPSCGEHVTVTGNRLFMEATLEDPEGTDWTFHDAFNSWFDGTDVYIVDTVPASRSTCVD